MLLWCFMFSYVGNANVGHFDDCSAFDNRQRRRRLEEEREKSEFIELIEKKKKLFQQTHKSK
jgi:hypothetical protein